MRPQTSNTYAVSHIVDKIATQFQRLCFDSVVSQQLKYCLVRLLCDVKVSGKWQMAALTGNRLEITYTSACMRETNEFQPPSPCYRAQQLIGFAAETKCGAPPSQPQDKSATAAV